MKQEFLLIIAKSLYERNIARIKTQIPFVVDNQFVPFEEQIDTIQNNYIAEADAIYDELLKEGYSISHHEESERAR